VRRPLPIALPLAAGALALLAGCGSDGGAPSKTTAVGCVKTAEPRPKLGLRGPKRLQPLATGVRWHAIVATNCGSFTIALDTADSPKTTAAFAGLARSGFYDDLTFHRVAPGFVIQGGDPLGSGTGGPGWSITEKPPRDTRYVHGVVAMAKTATDPDGTSGSQFFIVTGSDADLPAQYALLGRVTAGLDVVDLIDALPLQETDPQGSPPVDPVVIQSVTIAEG
jgi:peptidyl-prolyl cis-trans isomerase B (cyclophilin B)